MFKRVRLGVAAAQGLQCRGRARHSKTILVHPTEGLKNGGTGIGAEFKQELRSGSGSRPPRTRTVEDYLRRSQRRFAESHIDARRALARLGETR